MNIRDAMEATGLDPIRSITIVFESGHLQESRFLSVPRTTSYARYDSENTNTQTQGHFHLFSKNGVELFSINKDGSKHDGSKTKLNRKEIEFLKAQGFSIPENGILESISLEKYKAYKSFEILLE